MLLSEKKEKEIEKVSLEAQTADKIVDIIFNHIMKSLNENKSKKKIGFIVKKFIKTNLPNYANETKEFINGMPDEDIVQLLTEISIELEIWKRKLKSL